MKLLHIPKTGGTSLLVAGVPGGHHVSYLNGNKYITLIRDPVAWSVSYFSEQTEKETCNMSRWLREEYFNFQTKWLAKKILNEDIVDKKILNKIIKILKKDFIVIPTENIGNHFKLHLNKARKSYTPTGEEIELIKEENKLDQELYEWAVCNYSKVSSNIYKEL